MSLALQVDFLPLSHLESLMSFFLKHQLLWSKYPLKTQVKCHPLQEAFLDSSRCANLSSKSWVTISKIKGLFTKKNLRSIFPSRLYPVSGQSLDYHSKEAESYPHFTDKETKAQVT